MAKWNALLARLLFSGPPHQDYARHKPALEIIFNILFPRWRRDTARTEIYLQIKILWLVLSDWRAQWTEDPAWRPWNKEANGKHHQAFTDDEAVGLEATIIDNYVIPWKQFIGATFRTLAITAYEVTGRDPRTFKCSQHLIDDFKRRHRFSSRRFHIRWQHEGGRSDVAEWIKDITQLLLATPRERIVNCDEMMWTVAPNSLLTWVPIGEDAVSIQLKLLTKEAVTTLASITIASDKLPLFLIA
jgi:hypothetical protein